ncbi:MAG: ABC transporter ATP-binding protein/permease [Faecalibacterium sp.]|nr:ABC transporter ATP-binding protein/permease [Ruminococcus sp.]MCM1391155.1 ABC transporter ATP-binding protein/permease [Ruminococcus sp.]MCM1486571.1 ABC transporter ATP-binding protein/permease [Faecalibacterium sp.]
MIDKRLMKIVPQSKKYIALNVIVQWLSLCANIVMMGVITGFLASLFVDGAEQMNMFALAATVIAAIIVRFVCARVSTRMSYKSSSTVKKCLREKIYLKLLSLGSSYKDKVRSSELVQFSVEGVDQLETYFGSYLPQFFYAMAAPLTLFVVLCFVNVPSAIVLMVCVPLIPVTIVAIQKFAKKLLSKYWGQYTSLGDTFLENLQGLTTLKIYQADDFKSKQMAEESEKFRKITMKVLTMQLNSVSVMDAIAYGGAALGVIISVSQYLRGNVSLHGCMLIILLSADFFIPMRQLGSFFHIAMNGMAASDKIFKFLETEDDSSKGTKNVGSSSEITVDDLSFSYNEEREILHGISMQFPEKSLTAVVGESGCGKSTVANILTGRNKGYAGSVKLGGTELSQISEESLMKSVTYISHSSYLFKGTVRENLLMAKADASDEELWNVLEQVKLAGFLNSENGLDTTLNEKASNLSGGQRQRLALARALLHDTKIYIFDEATSNIDIESENDIMSLIYELKKEKTVIVISHRLANTVDADNIYVFESGNVCESGKHDELMNHEGIYARLFNAQRELENYGKGGEH